MNGTAKLNATVKPDDATTKTVTWKSDNEGVAIVDNNGNVTAKAAGTATITATVDGKSASCKVTVNGQTTTVPVQSVGLNTNKVELSVGEENKLVATVTPEAATNKEVTWSSNNPEVATVDQNGKVVAQKPGNATITVTTKDGNKTATCEVTVKETPVAVTGVGLNTNDLKLSAGEANTLVATVTPKTATNPKVKWSSNNLAVATVDNNGKVVAQAPGTATITVTTEDGNKTATCKVTVLSVNKEKLAALMQEGNNLLAIPTSTDLSLIHI